jgi:hypothetical protein
MDLAAEPIAVADDVWRTTHFASCPKIGGRSMTKRVELGSIRKASGKPASVWRNDLTVFDKTGFASSARSPPGRVVGRDQSHTTHFRSTKISIISEIHRT